MRSRRFILLSVIGVVLVLLTLTIFDYTDLNILTFTKRETNFSKTKILFVYPGNPATIWDEYNRLYKIYGNLPDRINVMSNTRIVIFTKPAILKSNADSIEIGKDYAKYKGYMGITTDTRKFLVNSEGEVYEVSPEYPEPKF